MKDVTAYRWSQASLSKLNTAHPLLVTLFSRVIRRSDLPNDLTILCGHRGKAEQDAAFKAGASKLKWPKSKHNATPSLAVDVAPLVDGAVTWDWAYYHKIAPLIMDEWGKMQDEGLVPAGVTLTWGGSWARFPDAPHWQIDGL